MVHLLQQQKTQNKSMIDNFFEDNYSSCDKVYQHPESQKHIYIGDMQAALDDDFLCNKNIRMVVTAAKDMEHIVLSQSIKHVVFPLLDSKQENITNFFEAFFQMVEKHIRVGNILVHCAAGISRSSTLVISYVMRKQNKSFKDSIALVRKGRPSVLPNLGFERQLKQYELMLASPAKLVKVPRRGEVKTSQSCKRRFVMKTEAPAPVNRSIKIKLTDILSINSKKLQQKMTPKDVQILKIYHNNRFTNARKQFKQRIQARVNLRCEGNAINNGSLHIPQRQSVSQEIGRSQNIYRKRIKTHLSIDKSNLLTNKLLQTKINKQNFEF